MKYRTMRFIGGEENVSLLGLGCMRFPLKEDGNIDEVQAEAMIERAINAGINYIDTAYPYHKGESEPFLGRALKKYPRNSFYLATKLPVWLVNSVEDAERLFKEQLSRLQTKYIDYYLLHALDAGRWEKLVKEGIIQWAEEKKASGQIRHLGFSFHDTYPVFRKILTYRQWDFCQIQYNYIDTDHQATQQGLDYAAAKGLGVIVMEPLLGGKLANPPKMVAGVLSREKTPVEWALDFVWNQPGVSLLLSGMSTEQQAEDNLAYASRSSAGMLDAAALAMFDEAKRVYDKMPLVPCTHCEYCMPCPFGVNIPETFVCYNKTVSQGMKSAAADYTALQGKAEFCRACRRCESLCPQHIKISEEMPAIRKLFADYKPEADD